MEEATIELNDAELIITDGQIVEVKSVVFPRIQANMKYFTVCLEHGILCYRGKDEHRLYKVTKFLKKHVTQDC